MDLSAIPVVLYLSIFFPFLIIIILLPVYIFTSIFTSRDEKEQDNNNE